MCVTTSCAKKKVNRDLPWNTGGYETKETALSKEDEQTPSYKLIFKAVDETPTDEQLEQVKTVYETRLSDIGYAEAYVQIEKDSVLSVTIPMTDETDLSQEELREVEELLSDVAKLTFCDSDGNVVVDGTEVKSAQSIYGRPSENAAMQYFIQLEFTETGAVQFADATEKAAASADKRIHIVIDGITISAPMVSGRIEGGQVVITGDFTEEDAHMLASQINSGCLPVEMTLVETLSISD